MNFRSAALSLTLTSLIAAPAFASSAPANDFLLLNRSNKPIGKASYSIDKTKNGFRVRSHFEYHLATDDMDLPPGSDPTRAGGGGARITEAQFNAEYNIDENGDFQSGYMRDSSTQTMTSFQPDKTHTNISINRMQAGTSAGQRTLGLPKPDFLIAPDYDPGVLQILLTTALAHPHADNTYLLIVPSTPDRGPMASNNADYVVLQPTDPAKGTLDGKPIELKHYLLNFHEGKADLYTDADGNLMEAAMDPLHSTYIRAKFALVQ